jgi:UDP-N-acetylglucosamine--N-acetylmuramyl-(pentapeptide) pyrophosphoryl-undecaprenol N-acetylglucosamine transferase
MMPARILVATGSSGGHIFPATAFLESMKEKHPDIETLLLLPEKSRGRIASLDACGYNVKYIPISSFGLSLKLENIKGFLGFLKGAWESLRALLKFHPDIVVGFGSLPSVPAVIFGWLLREKTLIHEQNVIPGKANKLLAEVADKIAVSFEGTGKYLRRHKDKIIVTGNPLRKEMSRVDKQSALEYFKFRNNKLTVLVMGGSQGSRRLNDEFLGAVSLIKDRSGLQIIHLTGKADYESLKQRYNSLGVDFALFDFFRPMHYAYCASDIALSRAGATTAAELAYFCLPAILVPYPYAYEHQYENAKALEEKGCAVIVKDKDLSAASLKERLEALASDRSPLERMRSKCAGFKEQDANELLIREVVSFD